MPRQRFLPTIPTDLQNIELQSVEVRAFKKLWYKPLVIQRDQKWKRLDIGKFKGDLPDSGTFILDSSGKSEMKIWRDDLKVCAVKEKNSKKIEISETITTKEACKL